MPKISLRHLALVAILAALPLSAARGAEATPPTISVEAEGKVLAKPDKATLILEVETQAPAAQAAAAENARLADNLLQALKKVLGPEEKIQSLGYRLNPVRSAKNKTQPPVVTAYQALNRFQVQIRDLAKLGQVLDTASQSGAARIQGPFWGHQRLDELQREAAVDALGRARRLAEALAQAAGLKIKGVQKIVTGIRLIPLRAAPGEAFLAAAPPTPTPVEVGEEEIKSHIQAVFELGP
jgi:uncharacterized protein YggE